jgi:superfamily II DNA or RNA helicase
MQISHFNKGMCRIMAPNMGELEPIRKYFRTDNPSKFYVEYHCAGAQAADYLYGISTVGVFKTGLLMTVLKVMKTLGIPYTVDNDILKEFFPFKSLQIQPTIHSIPSDDKFEARGYQTDAVKALLKHGRGVILLPTASGKSYVVTKTLVSLLESEPDKIKHCLILVPNTNLVKQFYGDLLDYGLSKDMVSKFCTESKKTKICQNTPIIISNAQWLLRHVDELPHIDVLFVDECHGIKSGSKLSEMIHEFKTNIRYGCTATLPNSISDRWELTGLIGPVLYKRTVVSMIEDNFISDLNITSIHVHDKSISGDSRCLFSLNRKVSSSDIAEAYKLEREYISENIIKLYSKAIDYIQFNTMDSNTLYLFDHISFGKSLFEYIKSNANDPSKVFYIDGNVDVNDRADIIEAIKNGINIDIVAQTTCFSTGINTPNLHNVVFVFNNKSDSKIMQSIGRGLRKATGKGCFQLFDINFNFKYSTNHYKARRSIYREQYNKDVSAVIDFKV